MNKEEQWTPAAVKAMAEGDFSNMIAAMTPGGIEAQEKAGQEALVNSIMLPKEIGNATREQLEAIGFVFGADADTLFVNVTLPLGWSKRATDHDMHSELLDDQGCVRAGIFYKAAFYDRRANIHFKSCYTIETQYLDKHGNETEWNTAYQRLFTVKNPSGTVLFTSTAVSNKNWKGHDISHQECKTWLDQYYPEWRNPLAYWDTV